MKKIILPTLLIIIVITGSILFKNSTQDKNVEARPISMKEKIDQFGQIEEEEEKIKTIVTKVNLDKEYEAVLFLQNNNNIGIAIVKCKKSVIIVTTTDSKQAVDQFKNYFIVFGEKPNQENRKLTIKIDLGNNFEVQNQSFNLMEGKYYLSFVKLPKEIQHAKSLEDYIFE